MKEQLISIETAKLAKEKGLNISVSSYFSEDGFGLRERQPLLNYNDRIITISAPTQSLLQKWLREEHKLHLDMWYNFFTCRWRNEAIINIITQENYDFLDEKEYDTYEEALEVGLEQALKLIK